MRKGIQLIFRREPVVYIRWVLGGIFAFASLDKILHPGSFAELIYNYQILPGAWVNLTALVLPWLELLLGLLLIFFSSSYRRTAMTWGHNER